ncbi:SIR2 family NAD-dependent protein deacylase [Spiribacter halobius]|nr:SIR2 family protein [Spiribacter halobius]UEX78020.1 SIR2 family protein [Spiribacter halobius]
MSVPEALINRLTEGRVILFLGAGALQGTTLPREKKPVLGEGLRELISDQFLDGEYKNESLAFVADLAVEADSLFSVQDFVASQFADIAPADFHLQIPQFNWRAIFTTNYDRLPEIVYEQCHDRLQSPRVILSNSDNLDETRRTNDIVPLVKLHGCITRTHDSSLPLILSTEQYIDYKKYRDRLFGYLYDLGHENTIVFVGHSLQDQNIREVIKQIGR